MQQFVFDLKRNCTFPMDVTEMKKRTLAKWDTALSMLTIASGAPGLAIKARLSPFLLGAAFLERCSC